MRVELSDSADARSPQGRGVPGATAYVYLRGTTTQVPVYVAASGATAISQPLTADAFGRFAGYVEENSLDLVISHPKFVTWTEQYEAVSGLSPGGRELGAAEITADYGSSTQVTAETDVTGLSKTVDIPSSRPIYVEFHGRLQKLANAGVIVLYVKEGSTYHGGFATDSLAVNAQYQGFCRVPMRALSLGSHTFKIAIALSSVGAKILAAPTGQGSPTAGPAGIYVSEH